MSGIPIGSVCLEWVLDRDVFRTNFFIYQATESSLVPAGFLRAQFLQKHILLRLCFDGGNMVVLLFVDFLEEREYL